MSPRRKEHVTLAERIQQQTPPPPTPDQLLAAHGLDGDKLMGLVRRAITDELGKRRIYLPPSDFEDLHSKIVEIAIGLAHDHDSRRGTLSLPTRIYRTSRWRTLDYIRRERIPAAARHTEETLHELANRDHVDHALLDHVDLEDLIVTKSQRQAWSAAATRQQLTLAAWLIVSLDQAATIAEAA